MVPNSNPREPPGLGPLHKNDTASVSKVEAVTGSHQYKITGYSLFSAAVAGKFLASETFTVGGHDWVILWYPGGSDQATAAAGYVSLFLRSKGNTRASNTAKAMFEFLMLRHDAEPHWEFIVKGPQRVFNGRQMWGYKRFMPKSKVLGASGPNRYVKDDCLTIMCRISVLTMRLAEEVGTCRHIAVPPSNYRRNFGRILESGMGADVAFDVGGQLFRAHRVVLAAQSPVFRAELYSGMRASRARRVKVEGMESTVFEALLHFIYNDALPEHNDSEEEETAMAQHLLAAADRYGVETLKVMCEQKLCEHLSVGNVAATLALAEQHQCVHLKEVCLDFMKDRAKVQDVVAMDECSDENSVAVSPMPSTSSPVAPRRSSRAPCPARRDADFLWTN